MKVRIPPDSQSLLRKIQTSAQLVGVGLPGRVGRHHSRPKEDRAKRERGREPGPVMRSTECWIHYDEVRSRFEILCGSSENLEK
jgi:hypothetical protein